MSRPCTMLSVKHSARRTCVTFFLQQLVTLFKLVLVPHVLHKRSGPQEIQGTMKEQKKKDAEADRKEEEDEAWCQGGWCWWCRPPPESKSIAGTPQLTILPSRAGAPISTQPKHTNKYKKIHSTTIVRNTIDLLTISEPGEM